jgi:hypothetical protein
MTKSVKVGAKKPNPSAVKAKSMTLIPLPKMYQIAVRQERARIIGLIQDYAIKHNSHPYFIDIIKLIQGETK